MIRFIAVFCLPLCVVAWAQPTSSPANEDDPALWRRMAEVNSRAGAIHDLVADFEQSKFTPLLKKPLLSKGVVRATTSVMLWDTTSPQPTVMRITQADAAIYYPKEKLLEVYPISGQLGALAASPLPDLRALKQYFRFEAIAAKDLDPSANDEAFLSLRLAPVEASLREHVAQVRVLIDAKSGLMIRFEMTDPDGDRTVMSFSNIRTNTGLDESQLAIRAPLDVKTVRPLENLGLPASRR
jgi:hypothetical protein